MKGRLSQTHRHTNANIEPGQKIELNSRSRLRLRFVRIEKHPRAQSATVLFFLVDVCVCVCSSFGSATQQKNLLPDVQLDMQQKAHMYERIKWQSHSVAISRNFICGIASNTLHTKNNDTNFPHPILHGVNFTDAALGYFERHHCQCLFASECIRR